jgi:hypothetical protein
MPLALASKYTPAVLKGMTWPSRFDMAGMEASTVGMS